MEDSKNLPEPTGDVRSLREPGSEVAEGSEERHADDPRVVAIQTKLPSQHSPLSWLDKVAVMTHEANRLWCVLHGDTSQPSYVDAPDWQKESAHEGVSKIASGEITTPEESHQSWSEKKIADGWQYGPVKDPEAKEHPCLVPYHELPPEQKAKDAIFFGIAKNLIDFFQQQHGLPRPTPPFARPQGGEQP
jgi:hypothetical protein